MSCNRCNPSGWRDLTCAFCGLGSEVYISIAIATNDDSDFPYSSMELCKECFDEHGVEPAFEHNRAMREMIDD